MGFMTEGVLWSLFFIVIFIFKVHRLLACLCVSFIFSYLFFSLFSFFSFFHSKNDNAAQ